MARLEAGPSFPTLPTVEKLARALALSPAFLAYGLGDPAGAEVDSTGLAGRAREARTTLGLSMRELARLAGVTDGAVRSAESGRHPAIGTLGALASALRVSPSWLAWGLEPRELPRRGAKVIAELSCRSAPAP